MERSYTQVCTAALDSFIALMQARLFEWHEQHKHVVVQSYEQNQLQVHGRRFYVRFNTPCRHLHNFLCIYSVKYMQRSMACVTAFTEHCMAKSDLGFDSDQTVVHRTALHVCHNTRLTIDP